MGYPPAVATTVAIFRLMQISERREGLALLTILTLFMGAITLTVALKNFNVISHFMTCVLWTIISSNINDYLSLFPYISVPLSLCSRYYAILCPSLCCSLVSWHILIIKLQSCCCLLLSACLTQFGSFFLEAIALACCKHFDSGCKLPFIYRQCWP